MTLHFLTIYLGYIHMFTILKLTRHAQLHDYFLEVERTVREESFRASVVALILEGRPEKALKILSDYYKVDRPRLEVGMPKRHTGRVGCYLASKATIHVACREQLFDPRVILHEFYHHLRTTGGKHRGSEKHANDFVRGFIAGYDDRDRMSCKRDSSLIEASQS